jgi:hypothetical protein
MKESTLVLKPIKIHCLVGLRLIEKMMNETIHFFSPAKGFASALGLMARQAFSDAFAHLYDPAPLMQFLDEAYGPAGKMERDFAILPFAGGSQPSTTSRSATPSSLPW